MVAIILFFLVTPWIIRMVFGILSAGARANAALTFVLVLAVVAAFVGVKKK